MKLNRITFVAALVAALFMTACQNGSESTSTEAGDGAGTTLAPPADLPADGQTTLPSLNPIQGQAPATATTEPAQNAAGVWHYTCAKGCAGGAGSATACASCGATLTHNQAYHAGANPAPAGAAPTQSVQVAPPSGQPEPAQNAAGVWHYTCTGGCAGGAGAAGNCAKCGKQMAHNQAYHQ